MNDCVSINSVVCSNSQLMRLKDFRSKEMKLFLKNEGFNTKKDYVKYLDKLTVNSNNNSNRKIKKKIKNKVDNSKKKKYIHNLHLIIRLQKFIRIFLSKKIHGPAYNNYHLSNNLNDFYSFIPITQIEKKYFYSFTDIDNFIYSFDVRSLKNLLDQKIFFNPYNKIRFSTEIINKINRWYISPININNDNLENKSKINQSYLIKRRVTDIFQKMDQLDQYTNVCWFNDLNINQLKKYYYCLEDIWNYRAELNTEKKKEIIQDEKLFEISVNHLYRMKNINEIKNIILNEIDKLITKGINKEYKVLGCLYVLTCFAEVSNQAKNELSWLLTI